MLFATGANVGSMDRALVAKVVSSCHTYPVVEAQWLTDLISRRVITELDSSV